MEAKQKKPYVKPMLVFENYATGELSGSPEMIAQIKEKFVKFEAEYPTMKCPFEPIPRLTGIR